MIIRLGVWGKEGVGEGGLGRAKYKIIKYIGKIRLFKKFIEAIENSNFDYL